VTDRKPINRRNALKCMGWAGTGTLFTLRGGIVSSLTLESAQATAVAQGQARDSQTQPVKSFTFLQISDTHIGFKKPANPDVVATLQETIAKVKALPHKPDFLVHTGDITHLATPEQFDTAQQLLSEIHLPVHFVPGEHDLVNGTNPHAYLDRFGRGTIGQGWYSFDTSGVHFIGLVNVLQLTDHGMGSLGSEQLEWLKDDVSRLSDSTPIVVLSHFPLYPLYPQWGWGTSDGIRALALLRRFDSVTALNGHIHQVQQKIDGNMVFHAGRSTAYPQPAPGVGPGPGPLLVPPEQLRSAIGISSVEVRQSPATLAIVDESLADKDWYAVR
jgi:Icc protein